jgi:hypothetical protein
MLSGSAPKMSRERLREIKTKDDISETHRSTDQWHVAMCDNNNVVTDEVKLINK